MSKQLINKYRNKIHNIIKFSGARSEGAISRAFGDLLGDYAEKQHLMLVEQVEVNSTKGTRIRPDGVLKNAMQLDFGFWEAKKADVDLDREIQDKITRGYPLTNTIFEDSRRAVLFQENTLVFDASLESDEELERLLIAFFEFEPLQIKEFNKALEKFKENVPDIVQSLRELMADKARTNDAYRTKRDEFLEITRAEINPEITPEDIREMMIQHILTEDIFNAVFDETGFHRSNNIAQKLEAVIETFMTRTIRRNYLKNIEHYYKTIRDEAARIADHTEKQKFLKVIYEEFYKVYNPKGADRLGVVYTPNEIVRFMIESTDHLLEKHFGRNLQDKNVEILDPATGTGTFITDLIDYIAPNYLEYKYKHEIHANEVAILPYYIANLNIEFTYQQKMGSYAEFENICFVDTLDNTDALDYIGKQSMLFGLSSVNAARIAEQNKRKISVIIGNPPYNAKQANYNYQNSNRAYKDVDKRIKETYIKEGTAQNQIVLYDMYTRFFRWATDRIDKDGIIAFITNHSFINSRAFDGFRKTIEEDFEFAYIIDTRSDVRTNPKIAGTTHNVFGIQTGVAITFLVRRAETRSELPCKIYYTHLDDFTPKKEKLNWIRESSLKTIEFDVIKPDSKHNWIDLTDNDFEDLMPLIDKDVKAGKSEEAIFELFSRGVETARDEWVYDLSDENLKNKSIFFTDKYNASIDKNKMDFIIKWSSSLKAYFLSKTKVEFDKNLIISSLYRPYFKMKFYSERLRNHRLTQNHYDFFGKDLKSENILIGFSGVGSSKEFHTLATDELIGLDTLVKTQSVSLYTYDAEGNRRENITDWALEKFREHYKSEPSAVADGLSSATEISPDNPNANLQPPATADGSDTGAISKEDIFHYVYAILHDPNYRAKYELNLKRDFPRIPFYDDFRKWSEMGKELMNLHINYETVEKYDLKRTDADIENPKPKLRADKENGIIYLDSQTTLHNIPETAWDYKLGNRSALEWILDQYKEKKPRDKTIAEKFNNYKFADHKEQVIELLERVCTVSVETMKIVGKMKAE